MVFRSVSLNVYNLWVSKELAMSSEVRGRCETPSYFFVYVASFLLSACCASADLSLFGCGLLSQIFVFV